MTLSKLTFALLACLLITYNAETAAQMRARRVDAAESPPRAQKGFELPNGEVLRVDTTLVILPVSVKDRVTSHPESDEGAFQNFRGTGPSSPPAGAGITEDKLTSTAIDLDNTARLQFVRSLPEI